MKTSDYVSQERQKLLKAIEELCSKAYCLANAGEGDRMYIFDRGFRTVMSRNLKAALTEVGKWQMVAVESKSKQKGNL